MDKKDRLNVAADVMQVKEELDRLRAENQHLQKDRNVMSLQLVEVRAENQRLLAEFRYVQAVLAKCWDAGPNPNMETKLSLLYDIGECFRRIRADRSTTAAGGVRDGCKNVLEREL